MCEVKAARRVVHSDEDDDGTVWLVSETSATLLGSFGFIFFLYSVSEMDLTTVGTRREELCCESGGDCGQGRLKVVYMPWPNH